jgi:hypothetical protein
MVGEGAGVCCGLGDGAGGGTKTPADLDPGMKAAVGGFGTSAETFGACDSSAALVSGAGLTPGAAGGVLAGVSQLKAPAR